MAINIITHTHTHIHLVTKIILSTHIYKNNNSHTIISFPLKSLTHVHHTHAPTCFYPNTTHLHHAVNSHMFTHTHTYTNPHTYTFFKPSKLSHTLSKSHNTIYISQVNKPAIFSTHSWLEQASTYWFASSIVQKSSSSKACSNGQKKLLSRKVRH